MNDAPQANEPDSDQRQTDNLQSDQPQSDQSQRARIQVSLSTILLAVALVAICLAYRGAVQQTKRIEVQLRSLKEVARDLVVDDATNFAAVQRMPRHVGDSVWDVFLPESQEATYQLRFAMDEIDASGFPSPLHQVTMGPGRHTIIFEYDVNNTGASVTVDGKVVMTETRPRSWHQSQVSRQSGGVRLCESFPVDKPLVLHRTRYETAEMKKLQSVPDPVTGDPLSRTVKTPGMLLWIVRDVKPQK